jgi:type I restriction enzyme S subunit
MSSTIPDVGIFPRGFSTDADFKWPLVPAGKLVELAYGDGLTEKNRRPGLIPVYGTNGRCGWHDTGLAKGPGVILGRKGMGPLGVEWCERDFWVIDTAYFVRPLTSDLDLKYFYYLVKYIGLNHLKDGTSNPSLTRDTFKLLLLPLPPRDIQTRIQAILSEFDDKIELNRRMNETLEALARRLFKSWFVDFDPVHAKATVRRQHPDWPNDRVSRAALPNLAPQIAELFPDAFEDSTLGPVPKGWKVGKLLDHTEATKGLSYKGSGLSADGIPMHNLNSIFEGGGYKFGGIKYYSGEYKDRHIIRPGEVIVANTEQGHDCLLLGYSAIVSPNFGDSGLFSHHTYRLRIKSDSLITVDYLSRLLNSPRMHDLVSGYGNGTTVNMLPIAGVEQPEFVVPAKPFIDAYSSLAADICRREDAFVSENHNLIRTRDRLLPPLLSGELTSDGAALRARKLK